MWAPIGSGDQKKRSLVRPGEGKDDPSRRAVFLGRLPDSVTKGILYDLVASHKKFINKIFYKEPGWAIVFMKSSVHAEQLISELDDTLVNGSCISARFAMRKPELDAERRMQRVIEMKTKFKKNNTPTGGILLVDADEFKQEKQKKKQQLQQQQQQPDVIHHTAPPSPSLEEDGIPPASLWEEFNDDSSHNNSSDLEDETELLAFNADRGVVNAHEVSSLEKKAPEQKVNHPMPPPLLPHLPRTAPHEIKRMFEELETLTSNGYYNHFGSATTSIPPASFYSPLVPAPTLPLPPLVTMSPFVPLIGKPMLPVGLTIGHRVYPDPGALTGFTILENTLLTITPDQYMQYIYPLLTQLSTHHT